MAFRLSKVPFTKHLKRKVLCRYLPSILGRDPKIKSATVLARYLSSGSLGAILNANHKHILELESVALSNLGKLLISCEFDDKEIKLVEETKAKLHDVFMVLVRF